MLDWHWVSSANHEHSPLVGLFRMKLISQAMIHFIQIPVITKIPVQLQWQFMMGMLIRLSLVILK
jgi:hypothetical protein